MATQGLVTVMKGGKVVAKMTAGCNGDKAREVAEAVVVQLNHASVKLLMEIAEGLKFGCVNCRVVGTRLSNDEVHILSDDLDNAVNSEDEDYGLWARKFDVPEFNPRWEHGTADNCCIANLDSHKVIISRYKGNEKVGGGCGCKPNKSLTLKINPVGDVEWDVSTGEFDYHISREEDEYVVAMFDSKVKDSNKAYVDSFTAATLDEALRACACWPNPTTKAK